MRGKIAALIAAVTAAAGTAGAAAWARGRKEGEDLELEVSEPRSSTIDTAPVVPAQAAAPVVPAQAAAPVEARGLDDLTVIKGLGKVKAAKLVEAGVTSYAQIAAWTDDDISNIGLKVNTSPGQIKREDWVGQAKVLAEG